MAEGAEGREGREDRAPDAGPEGQKFDLERALGRLEEIVERLERDDLGLDEAIGLFDEGTELLRGAERKLAESEGRLRQVIADRKGRLRAEDLDLPD